MRKMKVLNVKSTVTIRRVKELIITKHFDRKMSERVKITFIP